MHSFIPLLFTVFGTSEGITALLPHLLQRQADLPVPSFQRVEEGIPPALPTQLDQVSEETDEEEEEPVLDEVEDAAPMPINALPPQAPFPFANPASQQEARRILNLLLRYRVGSS